MGQFNLIVNGDDFGASEEVNEAVVRAFKEGCLTSCSLMVTGKAFHQAVKLARENEKLAVGIHLVTVMGRSVLPYSEIPHLVDRSGNFPNDPGMTGLKYYFSTRAHRELKKELTAQFARFASTGLRMSHVDSHLHMHVHPVIFHAATELAMQYSVRRMRVPEDDLGAALRFDPDHPIQKAIYGLTFRLLARYMKRKLTRDHFAFTERVYGNFHSGRMSEDYVLFVLDQLRTSTSEIYFHPAAYGGHSPLSPQETQCSRELSILMSRKVIERINHRGIKLINYFDLEATT